LLRCIVAIRYVGIDLSSCCCHRNPWISEKQQLECRESQSTNSSSSSQTYHQQQQHRGPGPPSSLWLTHAYPEPPGAMMSYNHQQLRSGGHFPPTDQVEGTQRQRHFWGLGLTTDRTTGIRSRQRQRIFPLASEAHPDSYPRGTGGPSPRVKRGRGATLTPHSHLVLRSRISRSYTSSPPWRLHGGSGRALLCFCLRATP
jgi:hypothetical protein